MVYGSSIYILFLWFINQHSHHWGGTTLYELSFLLRNSGRSRFPGGARLALAIKNVWRLPAFRGFQPLIDPQGAQIRQISWFQFWFMISSRLCPSNSNSNMFKQSNVTKLCGEMMYTVQLYNSFQAGIL
jgi:hypothetical protein